MRRSIVGILIAIAGVAALAAAMTPFRLQLAEAVPALLLLIPVVVGAIVGGYVAGVICVAVGFLVLDLVFVSPNFTFQLSGLEVWAAFAVYLLIMLATARSVERMRSARARERRRNIEINELFALSGLLVQDIPLDSLLPAIVTSLAATFDCRQVGLFVPEDSGFRIAASSGSPFSDDVVDQIISIRDHATLLPSPVGRSAQVVVLPLTATGRKVGVLALTARTGIEHEQEQLLTFANQIALAIERARLREKGLQLRLAEERARLAKVLVAAVSHDLRAPLSSIKASASILSDSGFVLTADDRDRLASLIDIQTDRLTGLVQSLLDMSRIQSGVLTPSRSPVALADLIGAVVGDLVPELIDQEVVVTMPDDLPPADVDPLLIGRVLTNLLMNAATHGPRDTPITISARSDSPRTLEVSVIDCGQGVRPERRTEIFDLNSVRTEGDAGTGLGLIIARTFVEAHGECIWVTDAPGGGTRFTFTVPSCPLGADSMMGAPAVVANSHN